MLGKFISLLLLILLSPILVAIIILIIILDGFPVFYCDKRLGLHGKVFYLIKFCTMHKLLDKKDIHSQKRVTKFGNILRRSSLDETPQLINILRGEMKWIGPRPLPEAYRQKLNQLVPLRDSIHPGLTGLAQVMGRNKLSWRQKFRLDMFYINKRNTRLNLRIICLTVFRVSRMSGIYGNKEQIVKEL